MTMTTVSLLARAPDGDVSEFDPAAGPKRRTFSAEYKARILDEYDGLAIGSRERGVLLRGEALYSSYLAEWRTGSLLWGGHDMFPYHFLGPKLGPRLYERLNGPPRRNRYGEHLFAVHVGPTLKLVRSQPGLSVDRAEPRYWRWAWFLTKVTGAREVLCWNCVIHVTKSGATRHGDG